MNANETTDSELIDMCLAGKDGYSGLYNRYARKTYNSICRFVVHTAEAEDILQESFQTVFSEMEKLNKVKNFEAWLKRIAINKSISHLRKAKISFTEFEDNDLAAEEAYSVEQDAIFEAQVDEVKNSIAQLADGYKTILNLYLFEDLQHEEIANLLGLSPNTVRSQYHRAKKRILSQLKERVYEK